MQGDKAANDIVDAIHDMESFKKIDVLIIGRGGGSLEDLWPFNEEKVANIPVDTLVENSPMYDRKWKKTKLPKKNKINKDEFKNLIAGKVGDALEVKRAELANTFVSNGAFSSEED